MSTATLDPADADQGASPPPGASGPVFTLLLIAAFLTSAVAGFFAVALFAPPRTAPSSPPGGPAVLRPLR